VKPLIRVSAKLNTLSLPELLITNGVHVAGGSKLLSACSAIALKFIFNV